MSNAQLEAIKQEAKRWKTTEKALEQQSHAKHLDTALSQRYILWTSLTHIHKTLDGLRAHARTMTELAADPAVAELMREQWKARLAALDQLHGKIAKQPPKEGA